MCALVQQNHMMQLNLGHHIPSRPGDFSLNSPIQTVGTCLTTQTVGTCPTAQTVGTCPTAPTVGTCSSAGTQNQTRQAGKLALNEQLDNSNLATEFVGENDNQIQNGLMTSSQDASTLTDVCNTADLPEVEIVSLIQEQIPKYRLRADTLTQFGGYDNADWIQTPIINQTVNLNLTFEQIEETLKYFILSAERLSQMTRTYNDIEAVTRLLEEKEKDLELAATIGQNLLEQNRELSARNELIEAELSAKTEKVKQLSHELSMKDELLKIYTQDESDSSASSPTKDRLALPTIDALQRKLKDIEDENLQLKNESSRLQSETNNFEEKEQQLVNELVKELADLEEQKSRLNDEIHKKTEECYNQQEQVTLFLAQICDLQKKLKTATIENAELSSHLQASQNSQKELTEELELWHERYQDICQQHEEAQDELRNLRSRHKPRAVRHHYGGFSTYLPRDSLASELEKSLKNEYHYPDGYSPSQRNAHNWKVLQTARYIKKASSRGQSSSRSSHTPGSASDTSCDSPTPVSNRSSLYLSENESIHSDGYAGDTDSTYGSSNNIGRVGIPGSNDLETALRRLTQRRKNEIMEQEWEKENKERIRNQSGGSSTPTPCRTPESLMSSGRESTMSTGSGWSHYSGYAPGFRIPEKLRIVKPMEGSMTLHHWQRLAQPHIGGIFEHRPGVQIKGQTNIDLEEDEYNLSDYEEDEAQCNPGKCGDKTGHTYTYTDSRIIHPDEQYIPMAQTSVTNSVQGSVSSCRMSTKAPNLVSPRDSHGTTTFSMSLGLASILQERGIKSKTMSDSGIDSSVPGSPTAYGSPSGVMRFPSIVTETFYDASRMGCSSGPIYTTTTTNCTYTSSSCIPSVTGLNMFGSPPKYSPDQNATSTPKPAVPDLNNTSLMDKIINIGISRFLSRGEGDKNGNKNEKDDSKGEKLLQPLHVSIHESPPLSPSSPEDPTTPPNSPIFMTPNPLSRMDIPHKVGILPATVRRKKTSSTQFTYPS